MTQASPTFHALVRDPRLLLAFGFGSGLSPLMPGTAGTLLALPFWFVLAQLPLWAYLAVLLCATLVGVYLCGFAARFMGVHDHGGIVWDEFVGLWIALCAAPLEWPYVALGFFAFRVFDMVKPWPISWADKKVSGGLGIMLDDVLAGVAALILVQGVRYAV